MAVLAVGSFPGATWAVTGAAYTTFDATQGGCLDSPNGVNCNHYNAKTDVYMSGGPVKNGLGEGCYYFSVLAPGFQNGGFIDGANGNLSDTTPSNGGPGGGDLVSNRTFHVDSNHQIDEYAPSPSCGTTGTHPMGTSPNGKPIIQLFPYDNTPNPGGVYILAVCLTGATSPSDCKYDAFKAPPTCPEDGCPPPPSGNTIFACKYFDANANGSLDGPDSPLANWPMTISPKDGAPESQTQFTNADGCVSWTRLTDGLYTVTEGVPVETNWFNSDPGPNPTQLTNTASVFPFKTVGVTSGETEFLDFENFCKVSSGGLTLGYWSNKNGFVTMNDDGGVGPELTLLSGLHLRDASGADFNPGCYCKTGACPPGVSTPTCTTPFRTWILNATATNMAYMLSAQLAAMELNVEAGFVDGNAYDLCSQETIYALMAEAEATLAANGNTKAAGPVRNTQERLKNCLDALNNGGLVVPVAGKCLASEFTPTPIPPTQ
jgi:hypothetical protein